MPLAQLLPDIPQARDVVISGLVMDSREVQPGDAFVAVAGFGAHGLCFIEDACARGAVAILLSRPHRRGCRCRMVRLQCMVYVRVWVRWRIVSMAIRRRR